MPFKEGKSGNPSGRPPGAKNKRTEQWEELGEYLTGDSADNLKEMLDGVYKDIMDTYEAREGHDRDSREWDIENKRLKEYRDQFYDIKTKLFEYFKPKQARHVHSGTFENKVTLQILADTNDKAKAVEAIGEE